MTGRHAHLLRSAGAAVTRRLSGRLLAFATVKDASRISRPVSIFFCVQGPTHESYHWNNRRLRADIFRFLWLGRRAESEDGRQAALRASAEGRECQEGRGTGEKNQRIHFSRQIRRRDQACSAAPGTSSEIARSGSLGIGRSKMGVGSCQQNRCLAGGKACCLGCRGARSIYR